MKPSLAGKTVSWFLMLLAVVLVTPTQSNTFNNRLLLQNQQRMLLDRQRMQAEQQRQAMLARERQRRAAELRRQQLELQRRQEMARRQEQIRQQLEQQRFRQRQFQRSNRQKLSAANESRRDLAKRIKERSLVERARRQSQESALKNQIREQRLRTLKEQYKEKQELHYKQVERRHTLSTKNELDSHKFLITVKVLYKALESSKEYHTDIIKTNDAQLERIKTLKSHRYAAPSEIKSLKAYPTSNERQAPALIGDSKKRMDTYTRKTNGTSYNDWLGERESTDDLLFQFVQEMISENRLILDTGPSYLTDSQDQTRLAQVLSDYPRYRRVYSNL